MGAGFVAALAVGYLLASWQGGRMPWQSASRPAVIVPGPGEIARSLRTIPNFSPSFASPGAPPAGPAAQGDVFFEQGRFREAIPEYQKAVADNPKDVDSWNDLGLALHYTGRSGEALDALRRGAAADPRYQRVLLSLGFVSLQRNRREEARAAWERLISIDPSTSLAEEARKFLKKTP